MLYIHARVYTSSCKQIWNYFIRCRHHWELHSYVCQQNFCGSCSFQLNLIGRAKRREVNLMVMLVIKCWNGEHILNFYANSWINLLNEMSPNPTPIAKVDKTTANDGFVHFSSSGNTVAILALSLSCWRCKIVSKPNLVLSFSSTLALINVKLFVLHNALCSRMFSKVWGTYKKKSHIHTDQTLLTN